MKQSARTQSAGKKDNQPSASKPGSGSVRVRKAIPKKNIFSSKTSKAEGILNIRRIRKAGKLAASKAMRTMGYVIVQEGEWVIKKYSSGRTKKIEKLEVKPRASKISFD